MYIYIYIYAAVITNKKSQISEPLGENRAVERKEEGVRDI